MDVVITHSNLDKGAASTKGIAAKLVNRLYKRGKLINISCIQASNIFLYPKAW
jgi:DNA polymerase mu